ncbi:unnamed protein product, partial [Thlaspi arvense]
IFNKYFSVKYVFKMCGRYYLKKKVSALKGQWDTTKKQSRYSLKSKFQRQQVYKIQLYKLYKHRIKIDLQTESRNRDLKSDDCHDEIEEKN